MNVTARIESTSRSNSIHVSKQTADILIKSGKSGWLTKRTDLVEAKGKGYVTANICCSPHSITGDS